MNQSLAAAGAVFAALLLAAASSSATAAEQVVDLWFKAFIPNVHPSLPRYLLRTERGTTVLPAPRAPAWVPLVGSFSGSCFATDDRTFDASPDAPARLSVALRLVVDSRGILRIEPTGGRPKIEVGPTHNVDCRTGADLLPPRKAELTDVTIGEIRRRNWISVVNVRMKGSNPFFAVAPSIDMEAVIEYQALNGKLRIYGTAGAFPAFEGYARVGGRPAETLLKLAPELEATATSLFDLNLGINSRNFECVVSTR